MLRHEVKVGDAWLDHSAWSVLETEWPGIKKQLLCGRDPGRRSSPRLSQSAVVLSSRYSWLASSSARTRSRTALDTDSSAERADYGLLTTETEYEEEGRPRRAALPS